MRRTALVLALLLSIPGPSAWAAVASAVNPVSAGVPVIPFAVAPIGGAASALAPAGVSALTLTPSFSSPPAPSLTLIRTLSGASVKTGASIVSPASESPATADARATATARPVSSRAGAAPAAARLSAPATPEASNAVSTVEAARSPVADAAAFFDGAKVYLAVPGRTPREMTMAELEGVLASDPDARAAFARKGRVRVVLAKGGPAIDQAAARAALARMGVTRPVEIDSIKMDAPESSPAPAASEPATPAVPTAPAAARSRVRLGLKIAGWTAVAGLATLQSPGAFAAALALGSVLLARDMAFVWKQFRASLSRPTKDEVGLTLLARSWPIYFSVTTYVALFLPGHPAQFAAIMALTLALKAFHGFWVDTWASFQDRLARRRSYTYATMFNLIYGQVTGILFRLISWSAIENTVAPWMLSYWRDMGIMTIVGTFFGTLGSQAINDLYNSGVLSRRARSWLLVGRSTAFDLPGLFFRVGLMNLFWMAFAVQQSLDVIIYLAAQFVRPRAILYITPPAVAASAEFRRLYPVEPAVSVSAARKAMRALVDNPVVFPFAALWRWVSARRAAAKAAALAGALALSPQSPAASYARAVAGASMNDPVVLTRLPVTVLETKDGLPVPVSPRGISKPVISRYDGTARGVFKPIRMPVDDPLYPYERLKLVRDVVSARVVESMGVPTVDYRLARTTMEGRETLGVESRFRPMRSLKHAPELGTSIVNGDEFVRGAVIDAWLGNVDRIQNRGNIWVEEASDGPRALFGDYDQGMRLGLEVFGVPKVPSELFAYHAARQPDALRRAVADILALDDEAIGALVDGALAEMSGFGAEAADYLKLVLIANRDELRRRDPFTPLVDGRPSPLRLDEAAAKALGDAVLQGRRVADARVPALVDALMKELISLWDKPQLVEPTRALLERVARARLAGRDEAVESVEGGTEMFKVLTNLAYMKLEPSAAMEAGVGYHR